MNLQGQKCLSMSLNYNRQQSQASSSKFKQQNQGSYKLYAQQDEPLILRAAKNKQVERPPCWLMRQAGRYQQSYRDLAIKHPSFRDRSEHVDLCVEISLQPYHAFKPDAVIIFSDILTPISAFGIDFEIDNNKGPIIPQPVRAREDVEKRFHKIDFSQLEFVQKSLQTLRSNIDNQTGLIGFVGSPWTLSTYIIEGKTSNQYIISKKMAYNEPQLLKSILQFVAEQIAEYAKFQIRSGAQIIQIFDSWGGYLTPSMWEEFSQPYIKYIIQTIKQEFPDTPIVAFAAGSGGFIDRLAKSGCDVVGVDWQVDMADARKRIGQELAVQGNVDPVVLYSSQQAIEQAVKDVVKKAGNKGHILNLGHGVFADTPEQNVKFLFDLSKQLKY